MDIVLVILLLVAVAVGQTVWQARREQQRRADLVDALAEQYARTARLEQELAEVQTAMGAYVRWATGLEKQGLSKVVPQEQHTRPLGRIDTPPA